MTDEYRKQITQAKALDDKELEKHASVGRVCGCWDCFCCAADHVRYVRELEKKSNPQNAKKNMNNKLAAKVSARNYVNSLANDLLPEILEAVKPFIGKKVALQTGGMSAKLDAALARFRSSTVTNQIWFHARTYTLEVFFRTCQSVVGGNSCVYAEQAVTFAELERNNGNLKEIYPAKTFRTDFFAEEIELARRDVTVAREAMRAAEWRLAGFGEHDNG